MRRTLTLFILLGPTSGVVGQAEFERLYAAAEARSDPRSRQRAFAAAYAAFARLTVGSAAYRAALAKGGRSALRGGLPRHATDLLAEQWRRSGGNDSLLTARLQALHRSSQTAAAIALARGSQERFGAGVLSFFAGTEDFGAVAGTAGALLLAGETEAGLWVFTAQAAAAAKGTRVFALANLALARRQLGLFEPAKATYLRALKLSPLDWLFNDYGLLLKGRGRFGESARAFSQGIRNEESPGASAGATNLAVLFQRTGKEWGGNPVPALQRVLRRRRDAAFPRRLLLDILDRSGR